jgi:hypothetical protein
MEDLKESSDVLLIMSSIWCLAIITHSAPYEMLGDVYFVILGICVENWLRLMTFWHKPTTIMGRTRYISYHMENKMHLLSWGEQDTVVIMGRTKYICYQGENKIHLLSWGEQDTFVIPHDNKCILFST